MQVYIYIYINIYTNSLPWQGLDIKVVHIFSVEMDSRKRQLIQAQSPDLKHLFTDVRCFQDGEAHCDICGRTHTITRESCGIDWLLSGPSCKDISKLKTTRGDFLGCYQEEDGAKEPQDDQEIAETGTSGPTYKFGFKKAPGTAIII